MAGSVNKVILVARLGKDPEVRTFGNGNRIATLSCATEESWRDKSTQERKKKTTWTTVVVKNDRLVDYAEQNLAKGAQVYVEGALDVRSYEKNGDKRYVTEVVVGAFNGALTLIGGQPDDSDDGGQTGYGTSSGGGYR